MSSVLKAQLTRSGGQARALNTVLGAPVQTSAQGRGRWVSEEELDALITQAYEDGLHRGRQQVEQHVREAVHRDADHRAKQALDSALADYEAQARRAQQERWQTFVGSIAEQMRSLKTQLESEVTEWTFVAATRLLGRASEEQVRSAVRQVLAQARLREPVQILVHKDDLALLQHGSLEWTGEVCFAADPAISLGGCILRSPSETVDARLEVQLQFLREALDVARRDRPVAEN